MSHGNTDNRGVKAVRHRLPLPQLLIALGIIMCLAPVVTDLWFRFEASRDVTTLTDVADSVDSQEKLQLLAQARAYNAYLGGYEDERTDIPQSALLPYGRQLSVDGGEAMGWIEVPKAGIEVSVYHGIGEPALSAGVGHQPETSLPVGGKRSHCYLTGHSGMRQHRIFDGIRVLEKGDVFAVHVLGDAYAYRVTGWEIVDPVSVDVTPQDGDVCTLVTCTTDPDAWNPKGRIGVNDKRLLVHGVRCKYDPDEFQQVKPAIETYVNDNTRPALLGAVLLLAFAVIVALLGAIRKKKSSDKEHIQNEESK